MKKITTLWVFLFAVLMIGMTVIPASATITRSIQGVGDALIFPFFDADKQNIIVITNESANWIQAHVRLRTGAQSIEGRDFPLILSPGDMAVFGVTRQNNEAGDDLWKIDVDLDPHNFQYVRINSSPITSLYQFAQSTPLKNEYERLVSSDETDTQEYNNKKYGYIEVIGEAVFDQGLDKNLMLYGDPANGVSPTPTNTVRYIAAGNTLSDCPNVLSGRVYVMETLNGTGVAYNAIALANFRTNTDITGGITHRVENYVDASGKVRDYGVILTSENSNINEEKDPLKQANYTYDYNKDLVDPSNFNLIYEAAVSANNSWGPTLADGDDYTNDSLLSDNDALDLVLGVDTSVREVEDALRQVSVRGHYWNVDNFETNLVVLLPTKHHVMVIPNQVKIYPTFSGWKDYFYDRSDKIAPEYATELWDTDENSITEAAAFEISPRPEIEEDLNLLPYELNVLTPVSNVDFTAGRFVLKNFNDHGDDNYLTLIGTLPVIGLNFIQMGDSMGYLTETQY